MNIFVLSADPIQAAIVQCDKHVVKMCSEACQMLSTVMWKSGVPGPMKPTHNNHRCTVWAGKTRSNFEWLLKHGLELCAEYSRRYGKIHATELKLLTIVTSEFRPPDGPLTPFAVAINDNFKSLIIDDDPIRSYKMFYIAAKYQFAKWNHGRNPPKWWTNYFSETKAL
jgi:hypothetical protein